ncbi:Protein SMG7 [Fasciola hepatica]|uniref:Protein SMG7 n=1 Tax=Fasciola hepatica TaxID=6192 RepID=A0A4E0R2Q0_FASHE|nr:Protein SMG7 [Fasciola hepatica]
MISEDHVSGRESETLGTKEKLLRELRALISRKPAEGSPPSVEDEFHLRTHDLYFEIISRFPSFAIEQKLELEMWNSLYKAPMDALHNSVNHRSINGAVSGHPRTMMELKLRCGLLLDRASGVYIALIYRLLQSVNESSWPKSLLGTVSSTACPSGLFQLSRSGRTTGRFDLDLATFTALHQFSKADILVLNTWWRRSGTEFETVTGSGNPGISATTAPRILSRGDRLPSECASKVNEASEAADINSTDENQVFKEIDQQHDECATVQQIETTGQPGTTGGLSTSDSPGKLTGSRPDHITSVSYIVQHCLVHLGDVARYRQKPNVAASYYLWAWAVHPDSGHPFNQLAILESAKPTNKRHLEALFYYYVRATSCLYPFPVATANLRAILRSHLGALQAATVPAETNPHNLLLFIYAALELRLDPPRLFPMIQEFSKIVSNTPVVCVKDQWIHRLVIIHIYLLDSCFSRVSMDKLRDHKRPEHFLSFEKIDTVICLALLELMIHLIHWLAEIHHQQRTTATAGKTDLGSHAPLSGLLLWFLWLRKQAQVAEVTEVLNMLIQDYIPSLSESVIRLLNTIESTTTDRTSGTNSSESKNIPDTEETALNVPMDLWARLIQLPELIILQGFKPLDIPTQCQLGLNPAVGLQCPLRISHLDPVNFNSSSADEIGSDKPVFLNTLDPIEEQCLRITCLLQSAKIVARSFPSLFQQTDSPSHAGTKFVSSSISSGGWMGFVPKTFHRRKQASVGTPSTDVSLSTVTSVVITTQSTTHVDEGRPSPDANLLASKVDATEVDNISPQATNKEDLQTRFDCHSTTLQPQESASKSDTTITTTSSQLLAVTSATETGTAQEPVSVTTMVATEAATTVELNTIPTGATPSGGLIVNAELAKFIQEQASQVAARQQRAGLHSTTSATDFIHGADITGSESIHRSSSASTFRSVSSGKGNTSSRLCLSAAFRRDLPPRFAKRLQAELLEREATESRQVGFETNQLDSSNWTPSSLDQPAPLARKESEAPYDLDSLLSVTDRTVPLSLNHAFTGPLSAGDSVPNPVHSLAPPHYIPHSMIPPMSVPSMFPPPASSVPHFLTGPRTVFGPSRTVSSTVPLSDWSTNQFGSDPSGPSRDHILSGTNPLLGYPMNQPRPMDPYGYPFNQLTMGRPFGQTIRTMGEYDGHHPELLIAPPASSQIPPTTG